MPDNHFFNRGADTYLHAGHGTKGWPHDHKAEDPFEVPPHLSMSQFLNKKDLETAKLDQAYKAAHPVGIINDTPQYSAAYTGSGKAILVLSTPERTIGFFDTFADAQLAAKALNELKGW
jgi:hypothetical protein